MSDFFNFVVMTQAKGYRVGPVYDDVLSMAWVFLELIVKSMALEQSRTYSEALPPGMSRCFTSSLLVKRIVSLRSGIRSGFFFTEISKCYDGNMAFAELHTRYFEDMPSTVLMFDGGIAF